MDFSGAKELEKNNEYDLCFLDMHVGEHNGDQIYQQLNNIRENTPVIAMSANFEKNDGIYLKKIGIKDYFTKSFNEQMITECLDKYLS